MLIVSKFHDYYDTAMTYGIDKTVVFERKIEEFEVEHYLRELPHAEKFDTDRGWVTLSLVLVGFCGKVYPGIKLDNGPDWTVCYDAEKFFSSAMEADVAIDWKSKVSRYTGIRGWRGPLNANWIEAFFKKDWTKEFEHLFVDLHTPTFTITAGERRNVGIKGDQLKSFMFQRVKDAPTAFQDIYMFLSGVLGQPLKPPTPPSDKEKAQIHGHDGEYSFKKPPGGKKWR